MKAVAIFALVLLGIVGVITTTREWIRQDTSEIHLTTGQTLECCLYEIGNWPTDPTLICRVSGGGSIELPWSAVKGFGRRGTWNK